MIKAEKLHLKGLNYSEGDRLEVATVYESEGDIYESGLGSGNKGGIYLRV